MCAVVVWVGAGGWGSGFPGLSVGWPSFGLEVEFRQVSSVCVCVCVSVFLSGFSLRCETQGL